MDILFALIRTIAIGVLGLFLSYIANKNGLGLFSLKGRMNRVQFALWFLLATGGIYLLDSLVGMNNSLAMKWVVSLPTYYVILALHFIGCLIIMPFFIVSLARRLQDINLPAIPGFILALFFIYIHNYTFITPEKYIVGLLETFLIILLIVFPGTNGPNQFGLPSLWPYKLEREPGKRKKEEEAFKVAHPQIRRRPPTKQMKADELTAPIDATATRQVPSPVRDTASRVQPSKKRNARSRKARK